MALAGTITSIPCHVAPLALLSKIGKKVSSDLTHFEGDLSRLQWFPVLHTLAQFFVHKSFVCLYPSRRQRGPRRVFRFGCPGRCSRILSLQIPKSPGLDRRWQNFLCRCSCARHERSSHETASGTCGICSDWKRRFRIRAHP